MLILPMVVDSWLKTGSFTECQEYQTLLLRTYSDDFSKYATSARHKYLQQVYNHTPGLVGQQVKFSRLSPDMDSRYLREAITALKKAGVIFPVYSTSASGLPLVTHINEKKFKLLFLDVGLVTRTGNLTSELLLSNNLLTVNRGMLTEQFVGQEFLAYAPPAEEHDLFFWEREKKTSMAEVDYVTTVDAKIIPVEVKSGTTGTLKSLKIFMAEKKSLAGVRISQHPLSYNDNILSLPLYMVGEMHRLIKSIDQLVIS